ncbi:MAG: protein phosphatase [Rhodobacteraceae bacterium HLUCCA12]|nr:MAG: protein phosphatase [Rhodobacteraceae bacterium HLUCCA12]
MRFDIFGRTEAGLVRQENEDHMLIGGMIRNRGSLGLRLDGDDELITGPGLLLAVADGIGGAAGGATASRLSLATLERAFNGDSRPVRERLVWASEAANAAILDAARAQPELAGMGCTLAGVCLTGTGYLVFHAGDSRIYRYRRGVIKALTLDDTLAGLAVRAGRLTVGASARHPRRHVLTNYAGSLEFSLAIEDGRGPDDGDVVMICSDGLHDLVPPAELESLFDRAATDLDTLGHTLIESAIAHGGHDNVSVVLLRFSGVAREARVEGLDAAQDNGSAGKAGTPDGDTGKEKGGAR